MSSPKPEPLFLRMYEAGLLDYNQPNYLELSDTEWMPPSEIEEYEMPDYCIPGIVPFAQNGLGDRWAWYTPWPGIDGSAVISSPDSEDTATGYAPGFAGCIYRLLLEEMAGSWLAEYRGMSEEEISARFRRYTEDVAPFLPEAWASTLRELSQRPLVPTGYGALQVVNEKEVKAIIERDLAFEGLNQRFKQYVESGA